MKRNNYPADFKEQALSKAHERGDKTLQAIADELNLSLGTLKNWLKHSDKGHAYPLLATTYLTSIAPYISA